MGSKFLEDISIFETWIPVTIYSLVMKKKVGEMVDFALYLEAIYQLNYANFDFFGGEFRHLASLPLGLLPSPLYCVWICLIVWMYTITSVSW